MTSFDKDFELANASELVSRIKSDGMAPPHIPGYFKEA